MPGCASGRPGPPARRPPRSRASAGPGLFSSGQAEQHGERAQKEGEQCLAAGGNLRGFGGAGHRVNASRPVTFSPFRFPSGLVRFRPSRERINVGQPWRYSVMVRGREVEVPEGEVTLSSSRSATVSVSDPSISRIHVRLVAREGRVMDRRPRLGQRHVCQRAQDLGHRGTRRRCASGPRRERDGAARAEGSLAARHAPHRCPRVPLRALWSTLPPEGSRACPQCAPADAGDVLPSIDLPPPPSTAPLRTQRRPRRHHRHRGACSRGCSARTDLNRRRHPVC